MSSPLGTEERSLGTIKDGRKRSQETKKDGSVMTLVGVECVK